MLTIASYIYIYCHIYEGQTSNEVELSFPTCGLYVYIILYEIIDKKCYVGQVIAMSLYNYV